MELGALMLRARQEEAERKAKRLGLEDIAEINAARLAVYEPSANVLRVNVCKCKCGSRHKELEGLFLESKHPTKPESRLVRQDQPQSWLPKRLDYTVVEVRQCLDCVDYTEYKENAPPQEPVS